MASLGRIGKYELLKSLAVGGMAQIYLARQTGMQDFEKVVVIKKILPHLASQERFVQMFLDEARLAARFTHPNIVQIYDLGQDSDAFYIAMEYVHGEDIKSIVRRCAKLKRRIPIEHVVKIFSGVLDGLNYAHSQKLLDGSMSGVVHRDVSPHNILVSFQGAVKLVDFGIAKARSQISTTIPGRVKGKHAYMSPEQCQGHDLDGRSDVFSAGIVMYELLSWTRLFKRKHDIETLKAVTSAEVKPLSSLRPEVDDDLNAIVLRALERDPARRYQTAQEMQMALEDYLLAKGLKSNPIMLSRFMEELFADKLAAMKEALEHAKVDNLEGAVLSSGEQGPDLVAFLDMFFRDSGSGSDGSHGKDSTSSGDLLDGPEFTPSGDYTPARFSTRPVARSFEPAMTTSGTADRPIVKPPPPRPPRGMGVRHVAPGLQEDRAGASGAPARAEPVRPAPVEPAVAPHRPDGPAEPPFVPPAEPGGFPGAVPEPFPPPDDPMAGERLPGEPDPYRDELMPTGKKGKGFMVAVILVLAALSAGLIYAFKDTEVTSDAPATGRVKIKSIPPGADVYYDDSRLPSQTPTEVGKVEPGIEHTLRVTLPRHPSWEKKFVLDDTRKPLEFTAVLSKDAAQKAKVAGKPIIAGIEGEGHGSIKVRSKPPGAAVYLDGIFTGKKTPTVLRRVAAGLDHVIMLEHRAKELAFERVHLDDGGEALVDLALEDGSPKRSGRTKVYIETEPEGASVRVLGYPLKNKTPVPVMLLTGEPSEIAVELAGHKPWEFTARPVPGLKLTYFHKLKKK